MDILDYWNNNSLVSSLEGYWERNIPCGRGKKMNFTKEQLTELKKWLEIRVWIFVKQNKEVPIDINNQLDLIEDLEESKK